MSTEKLTIRVPLAAVLAGAAAVVLAGCRPFDHYAPTVKPACPEMEIPYEKSKVSLPAYRIEPPDMLSIEVIKLVPLPPYRAEVYDVLQIQVVGTLLDQPIDGFYLVEAEGIINLGAAYGSVRVVGMTIEEAKEAITQQLMQVLRQPVVSVQLARTAGTQQITGVYLVGPDGTINLRQYGSVHLAGKTLLDARLAIQQQLSQFFDSPEVSVDMAGYNSKVYYVITEGAGLGDNVVRVPVIGNETVLDAISQVGGLSQLSSKQIHVARPAPNGFGHEQILPVDWVAISRGGEAATNYQLMPGDRVFITEEPLVATNTYLSKLISPLERLLGVTSLGISTVRASQLMGRSYNETRSGL